MSATKSVKVTLGGEQRDLRYTNRSLVALEDETGQTLQELADRAQRGSYKATCQLVWAGLLHAEPGLKVMDVVDLVSPQADTLTPLATAMAEAMVLAFGQQDGAEPDADAGKQGAG